MSTSTMLTLNSNANTTFAGTIGDLSARNSAAVGGLTMNGSGGCVFYLYGANTYTGPTCSTAVIWWSATTTPGARSGVQVNSGATLQLENCLGTNVKLPAGASTLNGPGMGGTRGAGELDRHQLLERPGRARPATARSGQHQCDVHDRRKYHRAEQRHRVDEGRQRDASWPARTPIAAARRSTPACYSSMPAGALPSVGHGYRQ